MEKLERIIPREKDYTLADIEFNIQTRTGNGEDENDSFNIEYNHKTRRFRVVYSTNAVDGVNLLGSGETLSQAFESLDFNIAKFDDFYHHTASANRMYKGEE